MKYLVVLVVVLGFACGSEEEDLGLQGLTDVEDVFPDFGGEAGRQVTLDPALIIGNIISALGNLNVSDPNSIVSDILDALKITGGTAATIGGIAGPLAGLGAVKSIFDVIVGGILGLIAVPVNIANMILSIVGLVVLIIFLIDGGDFGSLLGVARSSSAGWNFLGLSSNDLVNSAAVEYASDMFFSAVEKFENMI